MASTTKRKPAGRGKKSSSPAPRQRSRKQSPVVIPEPPLRQGLLEAATIGAQAFLWLVTVIVSVAALGGAAFGIWSLRPVPAYSSERVTVGSPFEVTFRVENTSDWLPLSNLKISCVLVRLEAPDGQLVEADPSRIPARLEPGESATFTCPLRAAVGDVANDNLDGALRSEIYFRSSYDVPFLGAFRLTDNRGPLVLNTRLLPPRWVIKPAK